MKVEIQLSIIIVTMNRQKQVIEALESCLLSKLPKNTEIIIVNNGSSDDTKIKLEQFIKSFSIPIVIKNLDHNIGAGEGRNVGIELASGKYLFFLDDDAVIDNEYNNNFFMDGLNILNSNNSIATLTTRIYDECLKDVRGVSFSKNNRLEKNNKSILLIHGGGVFVVKDFILNHRFPNIEYGFEELLPSIQCIDNGYINAYHDKLRVIHKPKIDKWSENSTVLKEQKCKSLAGWLTVKSLLYPNMLKPLIYGGFFYRSVKHFGLDIKSFIKCYRMYKNQIKKCVPTKKIKYKTVISLFKDFGMGAGL